MWPVIAAAAIGAGASLLSGHLGGKSADKARRQQQEFLQQGINQLNGQREWMLGDREFALDRWNPIVDQGNSARDMLGGYLGLNGAETQRGLLDNFQNDPGISYLTNQARRQMETSRAARGMLHSGGTVRQLGEIGASMANEVFNRRLQGLSGLAQAGQAGIQGQTATGLGYLDNLTKLNTGIAGMYGSMGTAGAAGAINSGNATTGAIQGAGNAIGYGLGNGGGGYLTSLYNRYFSAPTTTGWDATVAMA